MLSGRRRPEINGELSRCIQINRPAPPPPLLLSPPLPRHLLKSAASVSTFYSLLCPHRPILSTPSTRPPSSSPGLKRRSSSASPQSIYASPPLRSDLPLRLCPAALLSLPRSRDPRPEFRRRADKFLLSGRPHLTPSCGGSRALAEQLPVINHPGWRSSGTPSVSREIKT